MELMSRLGGNWKDKDETNKEGRTLRKYPCEIKENCQRRLKKDGLRERELGSCSVRKLG